MNKDTPAGFDIDNLSKPTLRDNLILFYYNELDSSQSEAVQHALAKSLTLQQEYAELCEFLDNQVQLEIPKPDDNLNQRIMGAIHQLESTQKETSSPTQKPQFLQWLYNLSWQKPIGLAFTVVIGAVVVFSLGRWSSQLENNPSPLVVNNEYFNEAESQRVLFNKVSTHLEIGSRLLTLVSNGNGDLAGEIESRQQIIEELVVLNRLYRRASERSGDVQLTRMLEQMEFILVELKNSDSNTPASEFNDIQERLNTSDLIYKMKVTNQKLQKQSI